MLLTVCNIKLQTNYRVIIIIAKVLHMPLLKEQLMLTMLQP